MDSQDENRVGWRKVICLVVVVTSCSGVIEEQEGEGPLSSGGGFRVSTDRAETGETWSAGSIPLCKPDTDQVVTLIGIAPVSVIGRVRLEGVGVRTTLWGEPDGPSDPDTHMVGIRQGVPAGVRSARGYSVPTCGSPDEPVGEVVVTLTMTGDEGGALDGLRVTYRADGRDHAFTSPFGFGLCGPDGQAPICLER